MNNIERQKESIQGYLGALVALLIAALAFSYFVRGELGINISLRSNTDLENMALYYTFDGTSVGTSTITDQSGSGRNTYFFGSVIATTSFAGATTTYTIPGGVTGALVKVWGAGGGGGAGLTDGFGNGEGGFGGAGGYSQALLPMVAGESITFESGKGGSGTGVRGGNGGGASTVKRGTTYLLIAGGGGGGGYGGAHCEQIEVDPPSTLYESSYGGHGGHGGGTSGTDGTEGYCSYDGTYSDGGSGGTSFSGGAGGTGYVGTDGTAGSANAGGNASTGTCGANATGCGGSSTQNAYGGGGGGGNYGGGGGEAGGNASAGGGGGSGYLSGANAVGYPGTSFSIPGNASDADRTQYGSTAGNGGAGTNGTGAGSTGANGLIVFRALGADATSTPRIGRVGQGMGLNGEYEYLSIATSTDPLRNVSAATFAAWFYVDTLASTSQQVLFDISSGTATATPRLEVKLENPNPSFLQYVGQASSTAFVTVSAVAGDGESIQTASTTSNLIRAGRWNHVVAVVNYASDSITVYVNGSSQSLNGTISFSGTATSNTSPLVAEIGRDAGSFVRYHFDGALDDVRLYHRALTSAEVTRLYHLAATTEANKTILSPTDTLGGLMSHWTFDGAEMTVATATNRVSGALDGYATSSVASYATTTFGSNSSTTIPVNIFYPTIFVKAWGGGGGFGANGSLVGGSNGAGAGFASTTITVSAGEVLSFLVGGVGGQGSGAGGLGACCSGGSGGTNGGGTGGNGDALTDKDSGDGGGGGGGGGYSAVLRGGTVLMVAAGGGGGGGGSDESTSAAGNGGPGGGTSGTGGTDNTGNANSGGGGGTSGSGGTAGTGTNNGTAGNSLSGGTGGMAAAATGHGGGGGGGGGYYGGGGGGDGSAAANAQSGGGAGGGSSYIGGGTGGSTNSGSGVNPGNPSDGDRVGAGTGGTYASGGSTSGRLLMGYSYAKGPTIGIGRIGQALEFNGTDQLIKVGNVGSGVRTIAFWMKADDTTVKQILNIDGTDLVELNSSSQVTATSFPGTTVVYVDGSSSSVVVATSTWHHVVITDTTGVNASTFEIGRGASTYFDGMIDDVRLYNRVLTANEVQRLYHLGATTQVNTTVPSVAESSSGLTNHYTFDGPRMYQNVSDIGTGGVVGRLVGFTSTTSVPGRIGQGLEFDGTDDYVTVGNAGTSKRTVAFWMKADDNTARKILNIDGTDQVELSTAAAVAATSFPGTTVIYINGQTSTNFVATSTWTHVVITDTTGVNASTFEIGRVSTSYYDGVLDDVRLYDRVLTAAEVLKLYQSGSPRGSLGVPIAFNEQSLFVRYAMDLYQVPQDALVAYKTRVAAIDASREKRKALLQGQLTWLYSLVKQFTQVAEAQSETACMLSKKRYGHF